MKQKLFNLLMILLLGHSLWAQTVLTVVGVGNESHEVEITTASCMFFHSDSLMVVLGAVGDSSFVYSYSDVKKLFFLDLYTDNKVVEDVRLMLYPNPVSHYFILEGLDSGEHQLSVFSMDGVEIIRKEYRPGRILDVSFLKPGIYIVRVGNGMVKFVKK